MHSSTACTIRPYEWFVSAAIGGLAITFIVRTIWLMDRGFDFTDESFYLAWARQPSAYDIAYGLFGYGLHPLFEIVAQKALQHFVVGDINGLMQVLEDRVIHLPLDDSQRSW